MGKRLKPIKAKDLIFSNNLEDDRTNTYLHLDDYDWMNYTLKTKFKTLEQGILKVEFQYYGMTTSQMEVTQILNDEMTKYVFVYDTSIFQKYIVEYMQKHISMWNDKYAFNGEEYVINFFNEVLEKGTIKPT